MIKIYKAVFASLILLFSVAFISAQECDVIYVVPNGNPAGAGTKADPANLPRALQLVTPTSTRLWLAIGNYDINAELMLVNNITIEGGFDPMQNWTKNNVPPTVIHRLNAIVLPPPANGTAIIAGVNVSGFRLQDLTLIMDVPFGIASSAYGIYLNGCSNYNIVRVDVTAADGTPGVAGTPGAPGVPGTPGANGLPACNESCVPAGGIGGLPGGGNGGTGGKWAGLASSTGVAGSCGAAGGGGGTGPNCGCGIFGTSNNNSCGGGAPSAGVAGSTGVTNGVAGGVGPAGTIAIPGYFVPGAAGGTGTAGTNGCGGGGGGGGGGRQQNGNDDVGGSGGGGGGGGTGGGGGAGGTGGGGSFAVFLFNNGAGGNITDCKLTAGVGGAGGAGGAGAAGAAGGAGGAGGPGFGCAQSNGAAGGAGGAGASGGAGGAGAQGLSMALSQTAGTPVSQNNILSVPGNPPVISVLNHGCTNAEIVFTTPIAGNWDFGSGAAPATATNTAGPVSVIYNSIGRKTITLGGTAFADFIELWKTQAGGSLTHVNNPAIVGCPDVFTDTLSGISYDWDFGANAIPATATTATNQSGQVSFTTTGSHTVVVWVTTICCGRVKDSLVFNVQPNSINITLTASTNTICAGDPITYTATPAGYQQYTFFVNNNPVQSTGSNSYVANGLVQGDSVRVAAFDGVCFSNPSAVLGPVVNPIPAVVLTSSDADDTICGGDLVTFTASPSTYASYEFFIGGSSQQTSPSNVWSSTTLYTGNTIHVVAVENGCTSPWSNTFTMFVKPIPAITLTVSDSIICQGDAVTFTAVANPGLDNFDFNLNGASAQNNTSNTYSSSAFNNNDAVFVSGSLAGCPGLPTSAVVLTVNPIPSVTLSSSDADNSICQGTSITFTASPSTYGTYDFFDGVTNVQSSSSNIYTTNLLTNPSTVTVVATDLGCVSPPSAAILTTVQAAPIVTAGNDRADCVDLGLVTLTGFSPAAGTWTGTGIANPSGDFNTSTAGAGIFSLVYSFTDLITGCSGLDSINYTVNALPVVTTAATVDVCEGQSAQLGVTTATGINFVWSPSADLNNANIQNPIATPALSTPYSVTVTDANNCSNTATTTVNVNPNPIADFMVDAVCIGIANSFTNNSTPVFGNTYAWSFGDGGNSTLDNPTHSYVTVDSFAVILIAQLGNCFDTARGTATTHPVAVADFTATPLVGYVNDYASPIRFANQSTNADAWLWNFGDNTNSSLQSPTHVYTKEGVYSVELFVSNVYGCNDTTRRANYITIYENTKVFIPNVFTPNGDGQNDVLQVFSSGTRFFEFKIFNRWGEKVFESNNTLQSWDGTYQGKESQAGVYTYTAVIVYDDNTNRTAKGTITLMR